MWKKKSSKNGTKKSTKKTGLSIKKSKQNKAGY